MTARETLSATQQQLPHDKSEDTERQCVKYSFFKVDPSFRRLQESKQAELKLEVVHTIRQFARQMLIRAYSLVGLRSDTDFLLWQVAEEIDAFTELATAIFSTGMGVYLNLSYSYLAMTRKSMYDLSYPDGTSEDIHVTIEPSDRQYLFVYPFVKTRQWYALPLEDRQRMMSEHIRVGRKYPQIRLNTTYSFGLDDQEFVVAFEGDRIADFLDLVMELRETEASLYTLRDTPTFTAINMSLPKVLDSLGGAQIADDAGPDITPREGWVPAIALSRLPEGHSKKVFLGSHYVAVFNVGGTIYAVDNRCPHARGPLAEGVVDGGDCPSVTCPWHEGQFDLATGKAILGPTEAPVKTYATRIDDTGMICIAEHADVDVPAGHISGDPV